MKTKIKIKNTSHWLSAN